MPPTNDDVCLLTVKQAAAKLRCAPGTIRSGELIVTRVGREKGYRIDAKDLRAFVAGRKFCCDPRRARSDHPRLKHLQI